MIYTTSHIGRVEMSGDDMSVISDSSNRSYPTSESLSSDDCQFSSIRSSLSVFITRFESVEKIIFVITNFLIMEHFDTQEHEANGHTPHHLFAEQRAERAKRIRDIVTRENLSELEP